MINDIRNAIIVQALKISHALLYYEDGGRQDWEEKRSHWNTAAAKQFQSVILALQLTSLTLLKVECGCQILPVHNVGSLAKLRCLSSDY